MAVAVEDTIEVLITHAHHGGDADVVAESEELATVSIAIVHAVGKELPLIGVINHIGVFLGAAAAPFERRPVKPLEIIIPASQSEKE